jgi:hypothetical protein
MADDDYQSSPDERQDRGPTPEELQAAEMAKTAQTLQLVQAMNQTVAPLPMTLPTQAAPAGTPPPPPMTATQPPPVAPVAPPSQPGAGAGAAYQPGRGIGVLAASPTPTNQGRMYMGPAMTAPQEQQFMESAPGTRMNLMPPPTPEQSAGAASRIAPESDPAALARLQAADVPGSRTIGVRSESPTSDASLANQRNAMLYNAMKKFDAGDRSPENMALLLGKTTSAGKRYNVAGVGLVDENGRVITPHPNLPLTRTVQGVGLVDAKTGKVIVPSVQKPETQTETETIPAQPGSPGSPAQAARSGIFGIGARPATPAVAEVPARGERKVTRKVPVQSPATDTSGIPQSFVSYLKAHPESAKSFDQKYGKGAAAKILQE